MSVWGSDKVGFFLVGPYNLCAVTGKIERGAELKLKDTTPLGVKAEEYSSSGVRGVTLTQEGWFDDAANSMHDALKDVPATFNTLMLAPSGNIKGSKLMACAGMLKVGYKIGVEVSNVHGANGVYSVSSAIQEGLIVLDLAELAGDGNSDAQYVDLGAGPWANGGTVYGAATAITLSGRPDVTIKLRHSTDHITFADHTSLTALAAIGSEAKTFAGAINRYVSGSRTWGGAGGTPKVTAALGVVVNP